MAQRYVTDRSGHPTGQWWDDETARKLSPPSNHGSPEILWLTAKGAWILENLGGGDTRMATVLTDDEAVGVRDRWDASIDGDDAKKRALEV